MPLLLLSVGTKPGMPLRDQCGPVWTDADWCGLVRTGTDWCGLLRADVSSHSHEEGVLHPDGSWAGAINECISLPTSVGMFCIRL